MKFSRGLANGIVGRVSASVAIPNKILIFGIPFYKQREPVFLLLGKWFSTA
jgi:hypothetical protein